MVPRQPLLLLRKRREVPTPCSCLLAFLFQKLRSCPNYPAFLKKDGWVGLGFTSEATPKGGRWTRLIAKARCKERVLKEGCGSLIILLKDKTIMRLKNAHT